jgi:hypothetical protein
MTIEKGRVELLEALAELSRVYPNWRLGQMLANVAMAAGRLEAGAVWDLEDDEALRAVQAMLQQHEQPMIV